MIIEGPGTELSLMEINNYRRIKDNGLFEEGCDVMLTEDPLMVFVNGDLETVITCSPQNMGDLILGWLRSEGYIEVAEDVDRIKIADNGSWAQVTLRQKEIREPAAARGPVKKVKPVRLKEHVILGIIEDLRVEMPLRTESQKAQSCRIALVDEDISFFKILHRSEDISRHSAMDKCIGWCMRNGVYTDSCVLLCSGQISRAMVNKALRVGIPMIIASETVTKSAIQLAAANNMTLIGHAMANSYCLYCEP